MLGPYENLNKSLLIKTLTMKKLNTITSSLVLMIVFLFAAEAQSQTVYQEWTSLPDSPTHLEVAWKTCKCSPLEADQIRLNVFNESGDSRTADFTLTVSDQGQTDVTFTVSAYAMTGGETVISDCGSNYPDLVFDVPAGFDPNTLTITIQYN